MIEEIPEHLQKLIDEKFKEAMLLKSEDRKRAISTLKAEIKNKEIELRGSNKKITSPEVLTVVQKMIKELKESAKMFEEGGRQDLVERNLKEIAIIEEFLPNQLTENEIDSIIKKLIEENNYTSIKDMGKVISKIKMDFPGQCDMELVSKKVKLQLTEK